MKLKLTTLIFTLGLFSLALLPNHDLLNFVFADTPLQAWKQFLAIILFSLSLIYYESYKLRATDLSNERGLERFLVLITAFLVISSLAMGLPLTRTIYGALSYIGLIGALSFGSVCISSQDRLNKTFRLFSIIGIFCSLGILIDYFVDILDFLPRTEGISFDDQMIHGYIRRASFLFGASTTIFPYLSFCIFCAYMLFSQKRSLMTILILGTLFLTTPVAAFLTGSRTTLILTAGYLATVLLLLATSSPLKTTKKTFAIITIVSLMALSFELTMKSSFQGESLIERYFDVLSNSDEGNSHRFTVWQTGIKQFFTPNITYIFGNGLGSTLYLTNDNFKISTHFESAILQGFAEGGILGLLLRTVPIAYIVLRLALTKSIFTSAGIAILAWIIFYTISITVSPTAGAYHTQFVLFFMAAISGRIGQSLKLPTASQK